MRTDIYPYNLYAYDKRKRVDRKHCIKVLRIQIDALIIRDQSELRDRHQCAKVDHWVDPGHPWQGFPVTPSKRVPPRWTN